MLGIREARRARTPVRKENASKTETIVVFSTSLGWMALRVAGEIVRQLTFGHPSRDAAVGLMESLATTWGAAETVAPQNPGVESLIARLQDYANGVPDDFRDVQIDVGQQSEFRSRVLGACREIDYGNTATYGELAVWANSPLAARAVGTCMATNRIPLIVPCHRVVRSGGEIGPYSAPGGSLMKGRLLEMEAGCFSAAPGRLG